MRSDLSVVTEARGLSDAETLRPMRVASAAFLANGIRGFELVAPAGSELAPFMPGAHILVRTPSGLLRRYSLHNNPHDRTRYCIAVRREVNSRGGSASMVDAVRQEDILAVSAPRNDFPLTGRPASYVFIAGGIGITPILSMIRYLEATRECPYKLYYLTRDAASTAFREELASPAFRGKVVIHHDGGDPARSFDLWPVLEESKGMHVYCCGPRPLMAAVRDMTGHWSASAVHFEDFGSGAAARPDDKPFTARLARSQRAVLVPAGTTLLAALRASGCVIASSCESGTCGTCRTRLLAGDVDHRDLCLAERERATAILPCVSRALSPELVLDL